MVVKKKKNYMNVFFVKNNVNIGDLNFVFIEFFLFVENLSFLMSFINILKMIFVIVRYYDCDSDLFFLY